MLHRALITTCKVTLKLIMQMQCEANKPKERFAQNFTPRFLIKEGCFYCPTAWSGPVLVVRPLSSKKNKTFLSVEISSTLISQRKSLKKLICSAAYLTSHLSACGPSWSAHGLLEPTRCWVVGCPRHGKSGSRFRFLWQQRSRENCANRQFQEKLKKH